MKSNMNKSTSRFTPALNNIRGIGQYDTNVRVIIGRANPKKKKQNTGYKIPKTPKVSGVGWGY